MARNLIVALIFCVAIVIPNSISYAFPYPVLDYASTGEDYTVSDCGSASVDILAASFGLFLTCGAGSDGLIMMQTRSVEGT